MGDKRRNWTRETKEARAMQEETTLHADPRNYEMARKVVLAINDESKKRK